MNLPILKNVLITMRIGLGIALLAALTGCVGYVGAGEGGERTAHWPEGDLVNL